MGLLDLRTSEVRAALRHPRIQGLPKLGRGYFCQVFDNGNTVLKLTCDRTQHAFYTDSLRPQNKHFPRLVENYGEIGRMGDMPLYLVEMEKLNRFNHRGKAWEQRKKLIGMAEVYRSELWWDYRNLNGLEFDRRLSISILSHMARDARLDGAMRKCCQGVLRFIVEFNCGIDFHNGNFMVRDDTLVLNDVVADIESIYRYS